MVNVFSDEFPTGGPNRHVWIKGGADKKFQELVAKVVKEMAAGQHVLSTQAASSIVTGVAAQEQEQTTASLKKARQSAQTKAHSRKRRREFAYQTPE